MKTEQPEIHCRFFRHDSKNNFNQLMKLSWTSLKISIAGAKLSHLVQKDRIWDHGSMTEQARIIFYLVEKARSSGNVESLKKQCSISCFEKIKAEIENAKHDESMTSSLVIKKLAIVDVLPGKNNKPDMFTALIKGRIKDDNKQYENEFSKCWSFARQGDWWLLDEIKHL